MDCIPLTLAEDHLVGSCEHGNKTLDFINYREFMGQLMNYQSLKGFPPQNYIQSAKLAQTVVVILVT